MAKIFINRVDERVLESCFLVDVYVECRVIAKLESLCFTLLFDNEMGMCAVSILLVIHM